MILYCLIRICRSRRCIFGWHRLWDGLWNHWCYLFWIRRMRFECSLNRTNKLGRPHVGDLSSYNGECQTYDFCREEVSLGTSGLCRSFISHCYASLSSLKCYSTHKSHQSQWYLALYSITPQASLSKYSLFHFFLSIFTSSIVCIPSRNCHIGGLFFHVWCDRLKGWYWRHLCLGDRSIVLDYRRGLFYCLWSSCARGGCAFLRRRRLRGCGFWRILHRSISVYLRISTFFQGFRLFIGTNRNVFYQNL